MKYFVLLAFFFFSSTFLSAQQRYITVTDVANRSVRVKKNPARVILGEGRMITTMAILDRENPLKRLIAWRGDLKVKDFDTYQKYVAAFPDLAKLRVLGKNYLAEWSLETLLTLNPDLVLLNIETLNRERESGLLEKLKQAEIAAVFIDNRQYPTHNSIASVRVMGKIFQEEQRAEAFIDFYQAQMGKVYEVLEKNPPKEKPLIFLELAAGWYGDDTCCSTFGPTHMGEFVELIGAKNWGSEKTQAPKRIKISFEALLSEQPDMIIGTGANWSQDNPVNTAVPLGYYANEKEVQQRLEGLTERKGWQELQAVNEKKFYSIYHQFGYGPFHFMIIQAFAKWSYPEIFEDLDPVATLKEMHEKFLPVDYSGVFLAKLQ